MYGSTEAGHTTSLSDWDREAHPGSVGRAAPPSVVLVDASGEILVKGPTLMDGYLDLPEQTADALSDGWYHTGDLGRIDDDGFVYITGRRRDVIRTGGETVAPAEVEAALKDHPSLMEVAVVGMPDDAYGEIVCAVVVLVSADGAPSVDDLRAHVADRLPRHAHPRRVAVVEALPHTDATGQVQRALVRELLL
jgi:acyl-CoA synthetase (AMP-forming)/AMP-acid ligase II